MSAVAETTAASRTIVEEYLSRLVAGRTDAHELIAPDARWWVGGNWAGSGEFGISEIERIAAASTDWFDGRLQLSVRRVIGEGKSVVVELHSDSRFADGRPYSNDYVMIYEVEDGRITSVREYLDTKTIAEGLDRIGAIHPALAIKASAQNNENM